jgi:surface antigen
MTMTRLRLASLALIVGLAPGLASAQINPFRGRGADKLTADDVRMLMDASNRLLARPSLHTGASESWKNDQSGASGSVSLKGNSRRHGLACRTLGYQAHSGAGVSPSGSTLIWCKTQDGSWKIAP